MSGFSELQSALAKWPQEPFPSSPLSDNSLERLRRVLAQFRESPSAAGPGDLAGLISHVLQRQSVLHPDARPSLRVPHAAGWPDEVLWRASCIDAVVHGQTSFLIRASRPWAANWLPGSQGKPPFVAAHAEEPRRETWPISPVLPLDPALEEELGLEFKRYTCPGQQEAIRAVFLLRPGGTLVINLPTGSGKSLVAWAPALMATEGALTVMVTPTVALALDQERQLREKYPSRITASLPDTLAWHSGLSESERTQIRRRLADGTQRILLASPESVVSSLARPLYDAATTGRLRYFVVDEAHLIAQWGTEFRPEFQSMCGLRRELLAQCPQEADRFKTLLLSATLAQESFDILRDLFAEDLFDHVSAVTLRPEPEYWVSHARHEPIRTERVIELIRTVPRPFLLYVTTRDQANEWMQRMSGLQIVRCGCVHGATPTDVRTDVIDKWRSGELDAVVATSAFGLGMDKSDVRAVIHACVPETVDRFYQEVGRGGRDGKACVSLLVYTDQDREVAKGLSSKKVITVEKGLERWRSMVAYAQRDHTHRRLKVNLSQRAPGVSGATEANNEWNLRTVVLLNRAGIIKIESERPPQIERLPTETDLQFQIRREKVMADFAVTCPVRLVEDSHLDRALWDRLVEPVRHAMLKAGWDKISAMDELLRGDREISEVLTKEYTLRGADVHVDPVPVCGGCCVCRVKARDRFSFVLPEPDSIRCVDTAVDPAMQRILANTTTLTLVSCPRPDSHREFRRQLFRFVMPALVRMGIREIAGPPELRNDKYCRELYRHSANRFLIHSDLRDTEKRRAECGCPRVTLFLNDAQDSIPQELINVDSPLHIIFAWDDIRDRVRPDARFFDRSVHTNFHALLRRLNQ